MSRARVTIRTALPAERDAVVGLIQELNEVEAGVSGDRRRGRAAAEAYYPVLIDRLARAEGRLLLAVAEGEVVGMMGFAVQVEDVYVEERLRRHGHVTELVVAPGWRGCGIGRRLLAEAERLARSLGLPRLSIGVLAGNEGAERLYRASGYGQYMITLMKDLD
jgi:GNAT superfamily N-acetyltransferase